MDYETFKKTHCSKDVANKAPDPFTPIVRTEYDHLTETTTYYDINDRPVRRVKEQKADDLLLTQSMIDNRYRKLIIDHVIFNDPATIVFWKDGTKTVVKCCEHDLFDPEKGLAMAICKKLYGNNLHKVFKKHLKEYEKQFKSVSKFEIPIHSKLLDALDKMNAELLRKNAIPRIDFNEKDGL